MKLPATITPLVVRYQQLDNREKIALITLAAFLCLTMLYFLVWAPINRYHTSSLADRDRQFELLQYMQASESEARSSNGKTRQALSGQALLTEVSRRAQSYGIKPNRLQPEGNDAISVWFDGVPFDTLIRLLDDMERSQGIVVRQISIDREERAGIVRARVVLRS